MYSPDIAVGLGSIVYALCKLDGQLNQEETKVACELLAEWPYSDFAICAMFLRDNVGEPAEEVCAFGLRRMADKRVKISKETKNGSSISCCVWRGPTTVYRGKNGPSSGSFGGSCKPVK